MSDRSRTPRHSDSRLPPPRSRPTKRREKEVGSVPTPPAATGIDDLDDVAAASPADDDVLLFDAVSGDWENRVLVAPNSGLKLTASGLGIEEFTVDTSEVGAVSVSSEGAQMAGATTSAAGALSASDKTKLDGIETAATADQTDAEIRAAVEAATDSNVFTDADHTKLNGIETGADVTDAVNVDAAGAVMHTDIGRNEVWFGDTGANSGFLEVAADTLVSRDGTGNISANKLQEDMLDATLAKYIFGQSTVEFSSTHATGVNTTRAGIVTSTTTYGLPAIPSGQTLYVLAAHFSCYTGASVGTYTVHPAIDIVGDAVYTIGSGGTASASNHIRVFERWDPSTAPSFAGGASFRFRVGWKNAASSPGNLASQRHWCAITYVIV